jgi:hypothetical protein
MTTTTATSTSSSSADRLRALAGELRDAGAVPPPIEVTVVPGIERDPGHGAKFKVIRSTVGRP